jgi:hypothetical protein
VQIVSGGTLSVRGWVDARGGGLSPYGGANEGGGGSSSGGSAGRIRINGRTRHLAGLLRPSLGAPAATEGDIVLR